MGLFGTIIAAFIIYKIWNVVSKAIVGNDDGAAGTRSRGNAWSADGDFAGTRHANPRSWERYFFRCLGKLAKADGHVGAEEALFIKQLFKQLNYSPETRKAMGKEFNFGRDTNQSFETLLRELHNEFLIFNCPRTLLRSVVQTFCALVTIDHKIEPNERQMLELAGRILGAEDVVRKFFGDSNHYGNARSRSTSSYGNASADPYKILDVPADASDAQVKKAYRAKMREFHPDNVQGRGLSEAYIEFAKEKCQAINDAYDTIKRERGIK